MPHTPTNFTFTKQFTFIDLFAGLGGIRLGFENVGCKCVFSSEWDKDAQKSYEANFGEIPRGDITQIASSEIPTFDILCAGFPCQPFSIIGDKEGFRHETQGTLFFEIERILREKKPRAFMLENVRNLTAHNKGRTFRIILEHLENLGYFTHFVVLNALDLVIKKLRIHLYKPIQIAEVLHRDRVKGDIDLTNLETYRNKNKAWHGKFADTLGDEVLNSKVKYF